MVDHVEQQILRKLDDDALAEARRRAKEAGEQELEQLQSEHAQPVEPTPENNPEEGVDDGTLTY